MIIFDILLIKNFSTTSLLNLKIQNIISLENYIMLEISRQLKMRPFRNL